MKEYTHALGSYNNMYILKWDYVINNINIIIYSIDLEICVDANLLPVVLWLENLKYKI